MPSSFSRSYEKDIVGRRVLIGLTYAETHEFEMLDVEPPLDEKGDPFRWEIDGGLFSANHARWLRALQKTPGSFRETA